MAHGDPGEIGLDVLRRVVEGSNLELDYVTAHCLMQVDHYALQMKHFRCQ